jgi:hypothetical protein
VTANFLLRDEKLFRDAQKDSAPLLHQRTRRLLLAVLACLAMGVVAVSLLGPRDWVLVPGVAFTVNQFVFRWLARRGTRGLALAPARLLDERQLPQVHSAYRRAYGITMAAVAGLAVVLLFGPRLQATTLAVLALGFVMHLMVWLPTCVLAWRLHDEDPVETGEAATASA